MKQQKRHQTNLISAVTLVITGAVLIFLGIALYNHAKLEVRFDTLINYLKQIDDSIVKLDSDVEIIICIFALYIAKCQLPIPMGFLCVISGMVFPLAEAVAINIIFTEFFFIVKYLEGKFIGGGWTGMILGIKKFKLLRIGLNLKVTVIRMFFLYQGCFPQFRLEWYQNIMAQCDMILFIIRF